MVNVFIVISTAVEEKSVTDMEKNREKGMVSVRSKIVRVFVP